MKRILLFVLLALTLACVPAPYVAVVPIDHPQEETYIGAVQCDERDPSRPVMRISKLLTPEERTPVYWHEERHVEQVRAYGHCLKFAERYAADSVFRFQVEADAFCLVFNTQRKARAKLDPTYEDIVWRLMNRYRSEWSREYVGKHLPCY